MYVHIYTQKKNNRINNVQMRALLLKFQQRKPLVYNAFLNITFVAFAAGKLSDKINHA